MPVYEYQGQHYELPDGLTNEQAISKIKGHLGKGVSAYDKYVQEASKPRDVGAVPGTQFETPKVMSREEWAASNRKNHLSVPVSLLEQGINLIGGAGGAIVAPIGAGMKAVNDLATGKPTSFEKDYEALMGAAGSLGTQLVDMTGLDTPFRSGTQKVMHDVMATAPALAAHVPAFNKNAAMRDVMGNALRKEAKSPVTPTMSKLDEIDARTQEQAKPPVAPETAIDAELLPVNAPQYGIMQHDNSGMWTRGNEGDSFAARTGKGDDVLWKDNTPYRADLSMDVPLQENVLQKNLFGDDMIPAERADRTLAQSIDQHIADNPGQPRALQEYFQEIAASKGLREAADMDTLRMELPDQSKIAEIGEAIEASRNPENWTAGNPVLTPEAPLNTGLRGNQRGGIDVKTIAEEAVKIGRKMSDVGKKTMNVFTPKEDVIRGIIKDNSLIPRGEAPGAIISQALAEGKDGPALLTKFQSGLAQAGDKVNSAVMKGVARHISWAEKVGDKSFRDNIKPLEQSFSSLSKTELADLVAVRIRAMNNRKQYTPEQLKEAGFSERQLQVYKQLEDNYAAVLEADNAARVKIGLKPISANTAYYASMWNGNYHIPVYAKDGTLSWYIKTESRREATKAINWLKENQGDLIDTAKLKYDYRPENPSGNIPKDVMGQYEAMLEVFKDTPVGAQIHDLMQQTRTEQAYTGRNFDVHFEHKKNVRGFIGDRPWLTHEENGIQGAKSQIQYLKEAARWAPMQEAMAAIKEVVTNPDLLSQQPNNMAMTKLYVDNAMGMTKNLFNGLEHSFGKGVGVSPGQMKRFVGTLKTLTYLKQLGFSTGYAIASVFQAGVLGPARHRMLTQEGYKHNVLKSFADSMYDTSSILGQHWIDKGGKKIPISSIGREALRYMEDNGLIDVSLFDEYAQLGEHTGIDTAKKVIGTTISFPEKVTRVMTFMSFVHHLKDSGLSKAEMFQLAEENTQSTLTNFHRSARPLMVDSLGMAGELAYTYKSPMFNFYNSLFEFAAHGKRTGDYTALASSLGMLTALGGVMNFPAMSELETGWQAVKKGLANLTPNFYAKWAQHATSPREFAMANLPDWALYGGVSAVTGAQMASRFTNEVVDFENPLQGTMPALQTVQDVVGSAVDVGLHQDKTSMAQAAYKLGMPVTKGLTEIGMDEFQAGNTSMYYNPNRLRERDIAVQRDAKDKLYRKLGLTSVKEAQDKEALWMTRKELSRRDAAGQKLIEAAVNKIVTKQNIDQEMANYLALGLDKTRLTNALMRGIQDANLTPQDRQALRAKTLNQVNGIIMRQELEK